MDGIINVYKPQEMTSHDVVAIMRRTLGIKKIGHTGTLDPMATGVLPICVGRATKIIEYLDLDIKEYRCRVRFGMVTDTQDIWGQVLAEGDTREVTAEAVEEALMKFRGIVMQKPPMYSAVKVNGKKLYEYARAGREVEVKARPVFIEKIRLADFDEDSMEAEFDVRCGKGTYIRTICSELGEMLGCGAVMCALERRASGIFTADRAVDVKTLRAMEPGEIEKLMVPAYEPLAMFGELEMDESLSLRFLNGQKLRVREMKVGGRPAEAAREKYGDIYRVFGAIDGRREFLGTGVVIENGRILKSDKIFFVR